MASSMLGPPPTARDFCRVTPMATHCLFFPSPNFRRRSITHRSTFSSHSIFFGASLKVHTNRNQLGRFSRSPTPIYCSSQEFDVVIVGAGIIGLTIARQFLTSSDLSVAIVDKALPCSGATGAGQGYLWMAHKTPGSDIWDLTWRSHQLWKMLAESLKEQGLNPTVELGWKKTGSLLVGRTKAQLDMLKGRVKQLNEAGLKAEYLCNSDLSEQEPDLFVDKDSAGAFLPDDCQLDAYLTVSYIEKVNRSFASKGRYAEFYNQPVKCFISNGEVKAIETLSHTLHSKKGIIVAAGCWTGCLMQDSFRNWGMELDVPVRPRKGHLLVLQNFDYLQLNHGLMEAGYVDHPTLSDIESSEDGRSLSVSMTATVDAAGNLLIGSSREFVGFSTELDESVVRYIWKRVAEFFPKLELLSLSNLSANRKVRIGLRPYMPDGKPMIGPVPGLSNVYLRIYFTFIKIFDLHNIYTAVPDGKPMIGPVPGLSNVYLAAGHEGGGLSMALGTAEMVADTVLGHPTKVDCAPFAVHRVLD
ncbi:uncharacterized protein LOC107472160 isoform X2 [Arachis duranensis]|uniref:FAD-dependent oxidoreductase domain-containing protein 1 n=1 Tax=Arachis duranensis TaxID=130453 RepID=A0A9C6TPC4_ARADU|nr:uncharacterized protein LOC107472160 isoform X2 [Arachis duranensis]